MTDTAELVQVRMKGNVGKIGFEIPHDALGRKYAEFTDDLPLELSPEHAKVLMTLQPERFEIVEKADTPKEAKHGKTSKGR